MDAHEQLSEWSVDTASLLAPPPTITSVRVFPDWITIDWEMFMRGIIPGWEPAPPFESLYQSAVDEHGEPICTEQMALWLDGLPDAGPGAQQQDSPVIVPPPPTHGRRRADAMVYGYHGRNGSGFKSAFHFQSPVPIAAEQVEDPDLTFSPATGAHPQPPPLDTPSMADAVASMDHPNPLAQHPVQTQQTLNQPHIPQRRSSLFFQESLHHNSQAPPAARPIAAQEIVMEDCQMLRLNGQLQPLASAQKEMELEEASVMDRRGEEVERLFGPDTGNKRPVKRARSIVSTLQINIESQARCSVQ